jgi:triacylglycerol lipase
VWKYISIDYCAIWPAGVSDFDAFLVPYTPAGNNDTLVHQGFYEAYSRVQADVTTAVQSLRSRYPTASIAVTGHSLGGALAVLCALDYSERLGFDVTMYTFGQPRVGNTV